MNQEKTLSNIYITKCSQLNTKLHEILDKIHTILKILEKEKIDGLTDPKLVLASSLHALACNITAWTNGYNAKKNENKTACLYLAPASYKEQMAYIDKTCSEPNVASKLSNQLKNDLSLLSQLFDQLYQKDDLEKINELNAAYATCLKQFK